MLAPIQQERVVKAASPRASRIDRLWLAPWELMQGADPWQRDIVHASVTCRRKVIVNASRQSGKTEAATATAYLTGALGGFVLVVSPSDDQSVEFMRRVLALHADHELAGELREPTQHELCFRNGGRVLARCSNERTVRIYSSIELLIVEEASRVPEALYGAIRPMLAVSRGREFLLSTPWGKRGFFFEEWSGQGSKGWRRWEVPWRECPRIQPEFVENERLSRGDLWVRQEYECEFLSLVNSPFDVEAMMELERDDYDLL